MNISDVTRWGGYLSAATAPALAVWSSVEGHVALKRDAEIAKLLLEIGEHELAAAVRAQVRERTVQAYGAAGVRGAKLFFGALGVACLLLVIAGVTDKSPPERTPGLASVHSFGDGLVGFACIIGLGGGLILLARFREAKETLKRWQSLADKPPSPPPPSGGPAQGDLVTKTDASVTPDGSAIRVGALLEDVRSHQLVVVVARLPDGRMRLVPAGESYRVLSAWDPTQWRVLAP